MRVAAVITGLLVVIAGVGWWASIPRTPKELYEARCSSCHALADLSQHRSEDMVAIIETMRHRNGAASVISESDAAEIIEYLKGMKSR